MRETTMRLQSEHTHHSLKRVQLRIGLLLLVAVLPASLAAKTTSMFVFGDDYLDTGMSSMIKLSIRNCGLPPYGPKGKPNGRCTNGASLVDQLATQLKLSTPGPYLGDVKYQTQGVSFATSGAGALGSTNSRGTVNLDWQLKLFRIYLKKSGSPNLNQSVVMISFGMNDYMQALYMNTDPVGMIDQVVPAIISLITTIQQISGAYRFVVLTPPPLGCLPYIRAVFSAAPGTCLTNLNAVNAYHESRMDAALDVLSGTQPNGMPISASRFSMFTSMLDPKGGFPAFTKPFDIACGTRGPDGQIYGCGQSIPSTQGGSKVATQVQAENIQGYDYWWWDWLNPTQNAYYSMWVSMWLGKNFTRPINVMELMYN